MSIGFKKDSIIGGPLTTGVINQLNARKSVVEKRTDRQPDDLIYLNSNTGWVKVTSSVNIQSDTNPNSYSSELAKSYQLVGGTAKASDGLTLKENSSYTESNTYGYIPTPGITSFSVRTEDTYGAIRTASFNFTVHSPEDFEKLEQLYLRPGFTILLEWGHSTYLDNDGTLQTSVSTYPIDSFLTYKSRYEIEDTLIELKRSNFYNYDAMYGFIKNFAWSYNGINYECKVDVVSKGEILSSIKSTFGPLFDDKDGTSDKEYRPTEFSSELVKFLSRIKTAPSEKALFDENSTKLNTRDITLTALRLTSPTLTNLMEQELANIGEQFKVIVASIGGATFSPSSSWVKYIPLRVLLIVINKISLTYDQNGEPLVSFFTGGEETPPSFTTFPKHFSIDPMVCLLPKSTGGQYVPPYPMQNQVNFGEDELTDILNIFVSVDLVLNIISERSKNTDNKNNTIYNVISDVIKQIQKSLGNINEFSLYFDDELSKFYIVDRKVVPSSKDIKKSDQGTPESFIDLVGLSSEVENLSIVSKLGGNLANMISLAAQPGSNPSAGFESLNIQKWNDGLVDRHLTLKTTGTTTTETETQTDFIKPEQLKKLEDYLDQIKRDNNYYIGYNIEGLETIHEEVMGQFVQQITRDQNTNPPGLIPFELSFTIKGIGGIKIGQAFRVNEFFLPSRYKNRVGFILTGIDHKVDSGRWTTDLKTQIFIL